MEKRLLIVESPTKAKKITHMLDASWVVIPSFGHIRDLPTDEMGVEPPHFKPHYVLSESGRRQINEISRHISAGAELWLATDPDREGEAISAHILEELEQKHGHAINHQRVTFNEISESAVNNAIANPRVIDKLMVLAQEARRVIDRRVGYLASPALTNAVCRSLSAGRVQSVAVRLVVDRIRAIRSHAAREHFKVCHTFVSPHGEWNSYWDFRKLLPDGTELWMDREQARVVAEITDFVVTDTSLTDQRVPPAGAFATSTLQQAASVQLGFRPDRTMELAQKLFDEGVITYHRTDSANISDEAFEALQKAAGKNGVPGVDMLVKTRRQFASRANAQEGHEAIRPALVERESINISEDANNLYKLIRQRFIASQMIDAVYSSVTLKLIANHPHTGVPLDFTARGVTLKTAGWKALQQEDVTIEAGDEDEKLKGELANPVPANIRAGSAIRATRGQVEAHKTRAPKRYTLASLVEELERRGIGRPATYASILKVILDRRYIYEDKKFLVPSEDGELLVDALVNSKVEFIDYEFTANTELSLDEIAAGRMTYLSLVSNVDTQLRHRLSCGFSVGELGIVRHACSRCAIAAEQNYLVRYRKKESGKYFWSCVNGHIYDDSANRPVPIVYDTTNPCPCCGKMTLQKRRGANDFFFTCASCGEHFNCEAGKPVMSIAQMPASHEHACLHCGKMTFVRATGQYGVYWRCKECKGTAKDDNGKPYLPETRPKVKCLACQNESLERIERGPNGPWWKCTEKTCGKTFNDLNGVPVAKAEQPKVKCLACGEVALERIERGKNGPWWKCSACSKSFSDKDGSPVKPDAPAVNKGAKCPHCNESGSMTFIPNGKYGPFWKCGSCNKNSKDRNGSPVAK